MFALVTFQAFVAVTQAFCSNNKAMHYGHRYASTPRFPRWKGKAVFLKGKPGFLKPGKRGRNEAYMHEGSTNGNNQGAQAKHTGSV
jgi:hypothetical protein